MITATSMLVCSPVPSELYNITVTCTIHPHSTADQCTVMAMDDGGVIRTGIAKCVNLYILQVTCCFYTTYAFWQKSIGGLITCIANQLG